MTLALLLLIVLSGAPLTEPPTVGVAGTGPTVAADAVIPPLGRSSLTGTATWYCGGGSPCTRGYGPSDLIGAIDPSLGIAKGTRVHVRHGERSVIVRVVDVCACPGARLIDLSQLAFSHLAPPSKGVIDVTITVAGPPVALPETDTEE